MIGKPNDPWFIGVEKTFIIDGFRNWKKAAGPNGKLSVHEKSKFHSKNINLIVMRQKTQPVNAQLQTAKLAEQKVAQKCLLTILSSLRYLMVAGLAVRGHNYAEGNFRELLEERKRDVPELEKWLTQSGNNYVSGEIQNEMIELMAHSLHRQFMQDFADALYFSVIADGTTDITGLEQFSISIRYVHRDSLEIHEVCLGMYNPEDTKGKTLAAAIKDVLLRFNLPLSKLRGACFDGASSMSGKNKGVQAELKRDQTKCLYVHCANHAADLALQEAGREIREICDVLCLVRESSNFILDSGKRQTIFGNIPIISPCTENGGEAEAKLKKTKKLIPLCPTRWCVRTKSLSRYKEVYGQIRGTFQSMLQDRDVQLTSEQKAKMRGYLKKLDGLETMFFLIVGIKVFSVCEQLARALQDPKLTATGAMQAAEVVIGHIVSLRKEEEFEKIYSEADVCAVNLNLEYPPQRRHRNPPKKLEQTTTAAPAVQLTFKEQCRKSYYAILDVLAEELRNRFDQEDLKTLASLEVLLISACSGKVPSIEELPSKLGIYAEDFNINMLHAQLTTLQNIPYGSSVPTCVKDLRNIFVENSSTLRVLLNEVEKLLILITTIAASAATAERSFSTLRRLKTYLRATMTQKRLTHVLILNIHKDLTKKLSLLDIAREFVSRFDRKAVFGKI